MPTKGATVLVKDRWNQFFNRRAVVVEVDLVNELVGVDFGNGIIWHYLLTSLEEVQVD